MPAKIRRASLGHNRGVENALLHECLNAFRHARRNENELKGASKKGREAYRAGYLGVLSPTLTFLLSI